MNEGKELVGRTCTIHIRMDGQKLFYTGTILQIDSQHIIFSDKYQEIYMFKKDLVVEIQEKPLK